MSEEKLSVKQKTLYGLVFAIVGSIVKFLFEYFNDKNLNITGYVLSFLLFWILGFFLVKKRKKMQR